MSCEELALLGLQRPRARQAFPQQVAPALTCVQARNVTGPYVNSQPTAV